MAVATARKMLAVVWRMLTDNRPWQETNSTYWEVRKARPKNIVLLGRIS